MMDHYKKRSIVITMQQQLIDAGTLHYEPDPTCPNLRELAQFRCIVFDEESWNEQNEHEQKVSMQAHLSQEAAGELGIAGLGNLDHVSNALPSHLRGSPVSSASGSGGPIANFGGSGGSGGPDWEQKEQAYKDKLSKFENDADSRKKKDADKAEEKAEKKKEKDRQANLASTKARGWSSGFNKELMSAKALLKEMKDSTVPKDTWEIHAKVGRAEMNKWHKFTIRSTSHLLKRTTRPRKPSALLRWRTANRC